MVIGFMPVQAQSKKELRLSEAQQAYLLAQQTNIGDSLKKVTAKLIEENIKIKVDLERSEKEKAKIKADLEKSAQKIDEINASFEKKTREATRALEEMRARVRAIPTVKVVKATLQAKKLVPKSKQKGPKVIKSPVKQKQIAKINPQPKKKGIAKKKK